MSPPALSSSLPTALLLSHLSTPHYKDAMAFPSLSFTPPHPPPCLIKPTPSLRRPLLGLLLLHSSSRRSLAHVRYATLGCFFVITFDLEVESGGVCRRTALLSWGIILWAPSHLNADGNILQWFNSTPCNIPNKDLFFVCPPPTPPHTPLLCLLSLRQTCCIWLTMRMGVECYRVGNECKSPWANLFWEY